MQRFPIRRSRLAMLFLALLAPSQPYALLDGATLRVRMGWLGRADVPLSRIASVGRMEWPWWGGVGVRIARRTIAFLGASGTLAVIELSEPLRVRVPLGWETERIAIGAEDVDGLIDAIARARGLAPETPGPPELPG